MPMKGLIILFFPQKKRITEQVHNDDAMKILAGIINFNLNGLYFFSVNQFSLLIHKPKQFLIILGN